MLSEVAMSASRESSVHGGSSCGGSVHAGGALRGFSRESSVHGGGGLRGLDAGGCVVDIESEFRREDELDDMRARRPGLSTEELRSLVWERARAMLAEPPSDAPVVAAPSPLAPRAAASAGKGTELL